MRSRLPNATYSPWSYCRQFPILPRMPRRSDILTRFGQRVRELRKARELSQEAFAEKCGLDRTYIGGIERGERNVALRNIKVIARVLKVTISELTDGL